MSFAQFETDCRTDVKAWMSITSLTNTFIKFDVDITVDIILVDGQLIFNIDWIHIAPFTFMRSLATCNSETRPFIDSVSNCHALFLGLPSLVKSFSARLQANLG
jgi:hypothetical protein